MSAAPLASRQVLAPKDRAKIISAIKKLVSERHINVSNRIRTIAVDCAR